MLGYKLTGKQSEFFNFRHSGALHIAARARDVKHLMDVHDFEDDGLRYDAGDLAFFRGAE